MNIALSFSGGGYRAAAFNMGVISYLSTVSLDKETLLQQARVLSTVSGGTITGAQYALGIKQGKSVPEIYNSLYKFMTEVDLVALALDRLVSDEGWDHNRTRSLINAIADIYDAYLFKNEKFGRLLQDTPDIHLRHISFNATEFANANQFRFQCSEEMINPDYGEPERGIIGNYHFRVPPDVAEHLRMADILAASSCFPGGFEPINFPHDFILPPHEHIEVFKNKEQCPVGLMDGGIVDNQGITPILLAESRMKRNETKRTGTEPIDNVIDLIIVSDVASPYLEEYTASKQRIKGFWRKLTMKKIFFWNFMILLVSLAWSCFNIVNGLIIPLIFSVVAFTVSIILFMLAALIKSLPEKVHVPHAFLKPLAKLLKLRLGVYETMLTNRIDSMLKMTNDVFLKHIRRLNYQTIFNDPNWKNRRIMNAIYELRTEEKRIASKIKAGTLPEYLMPSTLLQSVATKASKMGTTLWFKKDELESSSTLPYNLLDAIIACGQFTICLNLLEQIEKIKKDNTNVPHSLIRLVDCEEQLKTDWNKFKKDPYWMVVEFNKNI
jgi:predicted acylesterase/phospholipase RssA